MKSTGAHSCDICKNPVHAICGSTVGEERYTIYAKKEGNIKEQREHAAQNLKRSAGKMKDTSSKKFKDVLVSSTILIDVPKVDRGPLDANNIRRIVLNLFQIGTSVGVIKDY
ncbi:hypothetical protein ILUMI_22593 [Ignelater luminosus]|uniref:SCAN domain-containing protein n=1 Tax=Ignelater luminosus TaxID=2038154 RepID=A0A8K0FXC4_IGNLU|nr:hypothetical protein ILUMI_22593 [Ignelater luminosus]